MRLSHLAIVLGFLFLLLVVPFGGECQESWDKTNPVPEDLYALWGTTDQDIFSVGYSGVILHYNGTTWQESAQQTPTTAILDCLWGSASDNVFTAGNGLILRYTGTWSHMNIPIINRIYALWGSSETDVFAVGDAGSILHYNGTGINWVSVNDSPTALILYSIWGSASDNIYIGGEIGNIFQFNGTTWQKVADGLTNLTIRALWGSSASDIFAAGDSGTILHFNGTTWEELVSGTGLDLYCLWGSSGDDVFAAGETGVILKYNSISKTWSEVTPGVPIGVDIWGIWGSTAGNVYFAGNDGTIIRFHRDDFIPPVVVSTSIMTISSGKAYVTTPVVFHFSEVMDSDTINPSNITLTEKDSTNAITGTVDPSSDGLTATFTPNGNLAYSTTYTATVATGVKDAATAKNAMKSNFTLSFTTEDKPNSEGSSSSGCFISSACM
jgi:hypothetical protein